MALFGWVTSWQELGCSLPRCRDGDGKAADIPTSMHLIRQLLGVRPAADVEWHFCACSVKHAWPPLPKHDWRLDGQHGFKTGIHSCPHCGQQRFEEKRLHNGRTQLQPKKVRWPSCGSLKFELL